METEARMLRDLARNTRVQNATTLWHHPALQHSMASTGVIPVMMVRTVMGRITILRCLAYLDEVHKLVALVLDQVVQFFKVSDAAVCFLADLLELCQLHLLDARNQGHLLDLEKNRASVTVPRTSLCPIFKGHLYALFSGPSLSLLSKPTQCWPAISSAMSCFCTLNTSRIGTI
eukprot:1160001-Pelagomonas_calceolata.AAC.1